MKRLWVVFSKIEQQLLKEIEFYKKLFLSFLTSSPRPLTHVTWLLALAMPPRIENTDWSDWEAFKSLNSRMEKIDFIQKDKVNDSILWHGGMRIGSNSNTLEILEPDATHAKVVDWTSFEEKSLKSVSNAEAEKFFPQKSEWEYRHSRGRYLISNQINLFLYLQANEEQWRHTFLLGLDQALFIPGTSDLIAFRRYPAHLFYLGWGSGRLANKSVIRTYRWDSNSEILSVHACSSREILLTENLKNGLFRAVIFDLMGSEGLRAKNYILYAWPEVAGKVNQFEVTRVIPSEDCRKFLIGGSMGIWKMSRSN